MKHFLVSCYTTTYLKGTWNVLKKQSCRIRISKIIFFCCLIIELLYHQDTVALIVYQCDSFHKYTITLIMYYSIKSQQLARTSTELGNVWVCVLFFNLFSLEWRRTIYLCSLKRKFKISQISFPTVVPKWKMWNQNDIYLQTLYLLVSLIIVVVSLYIMTYMSIFM